MNRFFVFLVHAAVLLGVLLIAAPSQAGCPVTFRQAYHAPTYVAPAEIVRERVVEKVFNFARIVEIPLYSTYIAQPVLATYGVPLAPPATAPQQKSECSEALAGFKAMQAKVAELEAKLASKPTAPHMPPAEGNPDPFNPPQAQQADSVSRILSARCSSCHDEGRAKAAGKGIVLTQGGKAKAFAPEELGAIISSVSSKQMPRGVQMPDAERIELIAALTGAK